MRRAFAVATSGRPGPVVVDVPEDICHATLPFEDEDFAANPAHEAAPSLRCRPDRASTARAAALLAEARRPLVLAGGGVHISGAADVLTAFARACAIPVAHTMTGKGAIACTDPLSAGLFGRYDRIANALIEESDCLLVVGCKLGEIATKRYTVPPKGKTLIHLDIVAEEFGRTTEPDIALWGDARAGIEDLHEAMRGSPRGPRRIPQRGRAPDGRMARERRRALHLGGGAGLDGPPHGRAQPPDAGRRHPHRRRRLCGPLGRAALRYQAGRARLRAGPRLRLDRLRPAGRDGGGARGAGRKVVSLTGDGGFNMMLGELETARRMALDFAIVVVNNAASGYVKALQHLMYGEGAYHASDLAETNYAKVAEALGCTGIRVEEPGAVGPALEQAFRTQGPVVIDVVVTRDPAKMLPAVDNRTVQVRKGDRVA